MRALLIGLMLLVGPPPAQDRYPSEVQWAAMEPNWTRYVDQFSNVEYRLWDSTRVDYLGKEIAWEIDWAKAGKWAEAIGQSLYYSELTGRKPGIILLIKSNERQQSEPHVYRCQTVCAKYGIRLIIEIVQPL